MNDFYVGEEIWSGDVYIGTILEIDPVDESIYIELSYSLDSERIWLPILDLIDMINS